MSYLKNKSILVTGAAGTIGSELVSQLLAMVEGPSKVVGIDNNESQVFFLDQRYTNLDKADFFLCDVRNYDELARHFNDIDIVFHTAALKHVILCEHSPEQAVLTNVIGTQNVIKAAKANNVERVLFTSSDKAVNPTNVMGTSKLMGERLMTAANASSKTTIFSSTRFGNVLGSNGSVLPIFVDQIKNGGPVTVTDPNMTRFIMSISEAVSLVIKSGEMMQGGEVFITKMPVLDIDLLADVMIENLAPQYGHNPPDIGKKYIGTKPGEKLYEELMSEEEIRRAWELEDYFVVLPALQSYTRHTAFHFKNIVSKSVAKPYNSSLEEKMSSREILSVLKSNELLSS